MRPAMVFPLLLLAALATAKEDPKAKARRQERAAARLPACAACDALVASFERGMERTARGKFEGGDTAWEEKNQGVGYANSEVRFVEIQEEVCKDVERGEQQCHANHHDWEEDLEEWWRLPDRDQQPLRQWLCVERLEACCPRDHYGPKCKECSVRDSKGRLCSGNGKCKGEGTRKGNGKCACHEGYSGELCDACALGHHESYRDDEKVLCSACHKSCQTHCTGAGADKCIDCKPGYVMADGCTDINECLLQDDACPKNKYCVNGEGSFHCNSCSAACRGCKGSGPTNCLECADGFAWGQDGTVCVAIDGGDKKDDEDGDSDDDDEEDADSDGDDREQSKDEL